MVSPYSYGMSKSYRDFWNHYSGYMTGRNAYNSQKESYEAEIKYQEYLKQAYDRQLRDWQKNVPNRKIAYPELSFAGQMYRADTAIARSNYGIDTAHANYVGHMANTAMGYARGAGLYKVSGSPSRRL